MKFYPSLKSCQRALKLFIPLYPLGIPLLAYLFWFNSIFTIIICLGTKSFEGLFVLISLGILLGLIIYYEIVLVIYQFLLKILWKNPPQVISLPPTVWRNLYHLGVGVLGTLPSTLIAIILIQVNDVNNVSNILSPFTWKHENTELAGQEIFNFLIRQSPIWILTVSYIYEITNFKVKPINSEQTTDTPESN